MPLSTPTSRGATSVTRMARMGCMPPDISVAGDHGAHADHRADGQVDVAGDEQVALADADDEVFGHGAQEVDDVAPRRTPLGLIRPNAM